MAGAGLLIALGQIGNVLGIPDRGNGHQAVLHRLWLSLSGGSPINTRALVVGAGTVLLVIGARRLVARYRLPRVDMLAALVVVSGLAFLAGWSSVIAGGKPLVPVVGRVSASLPSFHVPEIKFSWIRELERAAPRDQPFSAPARKPSPRSPKSPIAAETRQALDYNRQCLAEGLANLGGGFFQCLPGSGSLTRSAINFQSGAVSRVSGLVAAGTVASVVIFLAPLARFIPKAALGGLLLITAARLVDWKRLGDALRSSSYDAALVLVTAGTAVFASVEYAILVGVALSVALFVPRAARLRSTELVVGVDRVIRRRLPRDPGCSSVVIYDIEGELFFGASPELDRYLNDLGIAAGPGRKVVVLRVHRARNPDLVCVERLERFLHDMHEGGSPVILSGVRDDLARAMRNMRFERWFPTERVFEADPALPGSSTIKAVPLRVRARWRAAAGSVRALRPRSARPRGALCPSAPESPGRRRAGGAARPQAPARPLAKRILGDPVMDRRPLESPISLHAHSGSYSRNLGERASLRAAAAVRQRPRAAPAGRMRPARPPHSRG